MHWKHVFASFNSKVEKDGHWDLEGVLISVFDQKIPIVTWDVAYGANTARLL